MSLGNKSRPDERGGLSTRLFLAGGIVLVGYAILNVGEALTHGGFSTVQNLFGPGGFVLGFLGLFLVAREIGPGGSLLARFSSGAAAVGALGFSVITLATAGRLLGIVGTEPPAWFPVLLVMVAIGMIPGYLAAGLAVYRSDTESNRLALLLVAPALIFSCMVTQATLFSQFGFYSESYMLWSAVAISGGQAVAHLGIGVTLRARSQPQRTGATTGEVATG